MDDDHSDEYPPVPPVPRVNNAFREYRAQRNPGSIVRELRFKGHQGQADAPIAATKYIPSSCDSYGAFTPVDEGPVTPSASLEWVGAKLEQLLKRDTPVPISQLSSQLSCMSNRRSQQMSSQGPTGEGSSWGVENRSGLKAGSPPKARNRSGSLRPSRLAIVKEEDASPLSSDNRWDDGRRTITGEECEAGVSMSDGSDYTATVVQDGSDWERWQALEEEEEERYELPVNSRSSVHLNPSPDMYCTPRDQCPHPGGLDRGGVVTKRRTGSTVATLDPRTDKFRGFAERTTPTPSSEDRWPSSSHHLSPQRSARAARRSRPQLQPQQQQTAPPQQMPEYPVQGIYSGRMRAGRRHTPSSARPALWVPRQVSPSVYEHRRATSTRRPMMVDDEVQVDVSPSARRLHTDRPRLAPESFLLSGQQSGGDTCSEGIISGESQTPDETPAIGGVRYTPSFRGKRRRQDVQIEHRRSSVGREEIAASSSSYIRGGATTTAASEAMESPLTTGRNSGVARTRKVTAGLTLSTPQISERRRERERERERAVSPRDVYYETKYSSRKAPDTDLRYCSREGGSGRHRYGDLAEIEANEGHRNQHQHPHNRDVCIHGHRIGNTRNNNSHVRQPQQQNPSYYRSTYTAHDGTIYKTRKPTCTRCVMAALSCSPRMRDTQTIPHTSSSSNSRHGQTQTALHHGVSSASTNSARLSNSRSHTNNGPTGSGGYGGKQSARRMSDVGEGEMLPRRRAEVPRLETANLMGTGSHTPDRSGGSSHGPSAQKPTPRTVFGRTLRMVRNITSPRPNYRRT